MSDQNVQSNPATVSNTEASIANELENDIFSTKGKLFVATFLFLFFTTPPLFTGESKGAIFEPFVPASLVLTFFIVISISLGMCMMVYLVSLIELLIKRYGSR